MRNRIFEVISIAECEHQYELRAVLLCTLRAIENNEVITLYELIKSEKPELVYGGSVKI